MPAKRKAEGAAAEDSESPDVDALPMTADMADELRENLIEKQKRAAIHQQEGRKKKRRIHNHPRMDPIDFDPTHFTPGAAPFFKLPRELRDEIYHWVWMDAPQIQQQYEKKYYMVTYGEIDVMKRTEPSDRKACWLLASKQMMLEGLTQFHRRSVWIFEPRRETAKLKYIFPLITPTLVHEQHLYPGTLSHEWIPRGRTQYGHSGGLSYFKDVPYLLGGSSSYPHIITPAPSTAELVDLMTTSTDAQYTVRKIKLDLRIDDRRLKTVHPIRMSGRRYFANIMFDFSYFDRLAVHRKLNTFEVTIQIHKDGPERGVEHLYTVATNLMTELEIVGRALVPGGKSVQVHPEPGWAPELGIKYFKFTVSKA